MQILLLFRLWFFAPWILIAYLLFVLHRMSGKFEATVEALAASVEMNEKLLEIINKQNNRALEVQKKLES